MASKYDVMEAKERIPSVDLMLRPHNGKDILIAEFGSFYSSNKKDMARPHHHSDKYPAVTFRPATTAESVSVLAYNLRRDNRQPIMADMFKDNVLMGVMLVSPSGGGVYINPFNAAHGMRADSSALKDMLNKSRKVNGIYLGDDDFAFVPCETFKEGRQTPREFAKSGLARGLEHSEKNVAPKISKIFSTSNELSIDTNSGLQDIRAPTVVCFRDLGRNFSRVNGAELNADISGYGFGVVENKYFS